MSNNIYVGNLAYSTDSNGLRDIFAEYGEVTSAQVIEDRDTGRSRGFGFVEMAPEAADRAIDAQVGNKLQSERLLLLQCPASLESQRCTLRDQAPER